MTENIKLTALKDGQRVTIAFRNLGLIEDFGGSGVACYVSEFSIDGVGVTQNAVAAPLVECEGLCVRYGADMEHLERQGYSDIDELEFPHI